MNLPTLLSIITAVFFGLAALVISLKKDQGDGSKNKPQGGKEAVNTLMVHELRSPISAIKDAAAILISDKSGLNKKQEKRFLKIIHKQSKLLLDQTETIINAAKLEEGKLTLTKVPKDIGEFVNQQAEMFLLQAKKKNISLKVETLQSIPIISFDPIRIGQVLNNLISNSIKFTKTGGKICVKVARLSPEENSVTISVSDTGIGIPKEFQKNLFSKFSQSLDVSKDLINQGSGLGLYMVKGIIEAHGGTINLESEPGKGTTFSFKLPIGS